MPTHFGFLQFLSVFILSSPNFLFISAMFFSIIIPFHLHPSVVVWTLTSVNEPTPHKPGSSLSLNHYFNPDFSASVTAFSFRLSILISLVLSHLVSPTLFPIQNRVEAVSALVVCTIRKRSFVCLVVENCWPLLSDCLFWQMRLKRANPPIEPTTSGTKH